MAATQRRAIDEEASRLVNDDLTWELPVTLERTG
jgi:hypothetical protein